MQCPTCRHENPAQAKFCLECGAQAQKDLTTARAMYGEMGMTYWLQKLEKGN